MPYERLINVQLCMLPKLFKNFYLFAKVIPHIIQAGQMSVKAGSFLKGCT